MDGGKTAAAIGPSRMTSSAGCNPAQMLAEHNKLLLGSGTGSLKK